MAVEQTDGWTVVTPSANSRLLYVSTSGNDEQARAVKGRGYYLPSDPEIGPDVTNPIGPIVAYESPAEAAKMFRGRNYSGDRADGYPNICYPGSNQQTSGQCTIVNDGLGFPDWLLFRRGNTFTMPTVPTAWGDQIRTPAGLIGNWVQSRGLFSYELGGARGPSPNEPVVITAWGPLTEERPIIDRIGIDGNAQNVVISSLETPNNFGFGSSSANNNCNNFIIEDCKMRSLGAANISTFTNARVRRCVISGNFSPSGHNQGFFLAGNDDLIIEECVFDMNGYKEDPFDPSTWTSGVGGGSMPVGSGFQPRRTWFDRNLYMSSYNSLILRGNIISRGGGGSSVQMREGGILERNALIWNQQSVGGGHPETVTARMKSSLVEKNLVLHDDHMLPPGGWGNGLDFGGADDDTVLINDNIVAHFHRSTNGGSSIAIRGKIANSAPGKEASKLSNGIINNNTCFQEFGTPGISIASSSSDAGVISARISDNKVAIVGDQSLSSWAPRNKLYIIGDQNIPSTFYFSGSSLLNNSQRPFLVSGQQKTFGEFQESGYETSAFFTDSLESFQSSTNIPYPNRDIVSYMESIDSSYVVDENVTTDHGVPPQKRRPNAAKVWEILSDSSISSFTRMSVDQAKIAARRYHAFLAFIERSKSNRKGKWNSAYTADALNNYIREGFGKSKVSGDYDNRNVDTRILEYFSEHGSVESLVLITQPIGNVSGQPLKIQPRIALRDASNTNVSSDNTTQVSVSLIQAASNGTLGGTTTVTVVNGVATFTDLVLTGTGDESYVLRFSISSPELSIDSTPFTVFQCQALSITPTSETISAIGGTGSVSFLNSSSTCPWTAVSDSSWLTITEGSTGIGENGSFVYNVEQNPLTSSRSGIITLNDSYQISITQQASALPSPQTDGWTVVTPSADSRIVYIAAESSGGNDASAAAVYGRGYYLPSDPEIGSDPTQPVGAVVAYRNPQEALKVLRGSGFSNSQYPSGGAPEWILFRRGDTFPNSIMDGNYTYWGQGGPSFWGIWRWAWTGKAFSYEAGMYRGRSETERFVISAWGPVSQPRPIFPDGFTVRANLWNTVVSSLDIKGLSFENSNDGYRNTLVEDCRTTGHGMMAIQGGNNLTNLVIRRCVIADGFNAGGHNSAPFVGLNEGARLTMEECVFDRNGYKENPSDATKWTGQYSSNLASGGSGEPGTGVQPTRTWFDRNWYLSGNAGKTLIVRGNIAARTGGGAEQMRSGGLAYRNVFLFNHDGLLGGSNEAQYGFNDVFIVQNLFLHDDLFLPPGGWGMNNYSQGANTVIAENIYAHPHSRLVSPNGPGTLFLWNMRDNFQYPRVLVGNVIRAATPFRGFATQRSLGSLDHPIVTIKNNEFAINQLTGYGYGGVSRTAKSELDTVDENLYFGNETSATFSIGYGGDPRSASRNKSFQTWQSAGYDINSQMISDWETFKSTAGWSDPERDIISYMQTIDPSYVPDENVRVDYGVPIQQSVPKLVKNSIPDSAMNEQQKILAAKRFHAAITFLLRARENRRGNWDSNYTAESLNDYIRSGFGKSSLSGSPYSLSLEDAFTFVSVEEPCLIMDLVPKTSSFTESGGTGSFTISTTNENCPWSAATNRDWLTLTQNASGTGSVAEISYSVAPNYTNSSRSGTITVGGQVHAVSQQSLVCTISSVEPTSISVDSSGGTGSISFSNASAICSWEAVSDSSWLTMIQGSTGTGESALIIYNVDQNPSNFSRVGTITLDDSNQISIIQEGFSIVETGNHVHKIKGSYSGQIERVFNKDYFLDLSVPVDRTITKIVAETSEGSCILELYKNNDQITQIPASTTENSITISSNNIVSAGDRLKIQINTNNRVRELKFSVHYEQRSEMNI